MRPTRCARATATTTRPPADAGLAGQSGRRAVAAFGRTAEIDNLRAAFMWSYENSNPRDSAAAGVHVQQFWIAAAFPRRIGGVRNGVDRQPLLGSRTSGVDSRGRRPEHAHGSGGCPRECGACAGRPRCCAELGDPALLARVLTGARPSPSTTPRSPSVTSKRPQKWHALATIVGFCAKYSVMGLPRRARRVNRRAGAPRPRRDATSPTRWASGFFSRHSRAWLSMALMMEGVWRKPLGSRGSGRGSRSGRR